MLSAVRRTGPLVEEPADHFTFAHRSLLEFLAAEAIASEDEATAIQLRSSRLADGRVRGAPDLRAA